MSDMPKPGQRFAAGVEAQKELMRLGIPTSKREGPDVFDAALRQIESIDLLLNSLNAQIDRVMRSK